MTRYLCLEFAKCRSVPIQVPSLVSQPNFRRSSQGLRASGWWISRSFSWRSFTSGRISSLRKPVARSPRARPCGAADWTRGFTEHFLTLVSVHCRRSKPKILVCFGDHNRWMSSSYEENQESDTSLSTYSPAPQSPQGETTGSASAEGSDAAMLIVDMMASPERDGTRLVSSRCQTDRPPFLDDSQTVTNGRTQKVYQAPCNRGNSPNSMDDHVEILAHEKNDITSDNAVPISAKPVEEQVPSLFLGSSNRTHHSQNYAQAASRMASSESATKSANTSSSSLLSGPLVDQGPVEAIISSSSASREATSSGADALENQREKALRQQHIRSATGMTEGVSSVEPSTLQENKTEKVDSSLRKVTDITGEDKDEEQTNDSFTMSIGIRMTPTKKNRRKRSPQVKTGQTTGRWTQAEHQAFLEGLQECGREWKKVSLRIPTRTSAQIRSHAQKYFAKLQRDQETLSLTDGGNMLGGNRLATGAVPLSDRPSLTPTIQRHVERIISNPIAAQQEVEDTLNALRNRYRQLQLRLEQRQQQRRARSLQGNNPAHHHHHHHIVDEADSTSPNRMAAVSSSSRKRILQNGDMVPPPANAQNQHHFHHDDLSSVSSAVSASVASMGNDELIALSVLGGSLNRDDSAHDLQMMAARESDGSVTPITERGGNPRSDSTQDNNLECPENENEMNSNDAAVLDGSRDDQTPNKRAKKN